LRLAGSFSPRNLFVFKRLFMLQVAAGSFNLKLTVETHYYVERWKRNIVGE
jgi:hypothetical protein